MNDGRGAPAGKADSKRGYLWDASLGDWAFDPDPELRTLVIYQETAGTVHTVGQLRLHREGEDLLIQVPEQSSLLRLRGWHGDGLETSWRLDKIQYRSGLFAEILNDAADWVRLSELVSREPLDQPLRDAASESDRQSVPAAGERKTGASRSPSASKGKPGGDVTHGDDQDNTIHTGVGPERIVAGAGDDRIVVAHRMSGDLPQDNKYIRGGPGNDTVDYKTAFDSPDVGITVRLKERLVTWGTSGHDRVVSVENIGGTVAADHFEGNAADNVMTGYHGNDVYLVTRGGGRDVIVDQDATTDHVDTLLFEQGLRREDLRVSVAGDDVVIEVLAAGGRIDTVTTIQNGVRKESAIERFQLHDGTTYAWWELAGRPQQADEPAPRLVPGDGRKTTYLGTDGNDLIPIGALHDKVLAGGGDDRIRVDHAYALGAAQNKEIQGGAGNDTVDYLGAFGDGGGIYATLDTQKVTWGRGGEDRLSGIEHVSGTDATDRFQGDWKDNVMTGRRGSDVYVVTRDGGRDEILDEDATPGHADMLLFGEGIDRSQLFKLTEGADLVIVVLDEHGQENTRVTIRNGMQGDFAIERFVLADGTPLQLDLLAPLPFALL